LRPAVPREKKVERSGTYEQRRHPRHKLDAEVRICSRTRGLLPGRTLDISESGMAVMLMAEIEVGELIGLEFDLPTGRMHTWAVVRNRTAFRYGCEFVRREPEIEIIRNACALLAQPNPPTA
jgi:hypothetical protein